MAIMVDISEAQTQLHNLLSSALKGNEVIISENNKPLAKLVPFLPAHKTRIPGLNKGKIWASEDFDDPLPDSFWTGEA
jgi:prevent-host-death family protein